MDINSILNSVSPAPERPLKANVVDGAGISNSEEVMPSDTGNSGSASKQGAEENGGDTTMIAAQIQDFQARQDTSSRRTRNNNRPASIQIENGVSSAPYQAQPSPHAPKQSSKLANPPQMAEEMRISKLDEVILEPNEYIIPISIPTRVYDQYLQVIDKYAEDHSTLLSDLNPSESTIRAMERMVVELDMVTTHPDLVDETVLEDEIDSNGGELNYSRLSSHKFGFLYTLLDTLHTGLANDIPDALSEQLRDKTQLKLAIVVWDGKLIKILIRFLLAMRISFTTIDDGQIYNPEHKDNIDLMILSSSSKKASELSPVDIILAFDSSFERRGKLSQALQRNDGQKIPVLFPWVYASPEHIRACLPIIDYSSVDSLRTFTTILIQTRTELGQLRGSWEKPRDARVEFAGSAVGQWILEGYAQEFPLNKLGPIELTGLELTFKSNKKRQLQNNDEIDGSSSPSKRRRTEDLPEEEAPSRTASTSDEITALKVQVNSLEANLRLQQSKTLEQSNELAGIKADFQREKETSEGLMHACDQSLNQQHILREKIADLATDKQNLETALSRKSDSFDKLKIEMDELRSKVKELEDSKAQVSPNNASQSLTNESADAVDLRAENQVLQKENTSLKRKAQSAEDNRAYAFHLYQEASSRAAELAGEVQEKQSEIDRLTPLAENHSETIFEAAAHSELVTTKLALHRTLAEKEELEEQLRRGNTRPGMSTRGQSSAPGSSRSPRVAVSPPPRSRASSRQPASRATSPNGKGGQAMRRALSGRLADS